MRTAVLASLLAAASAARAENFMLPSPKAGDLGLSVHTGLALPLGSGGFSSRAGRAPHFSLRLTRWLSSWVAWGGELGAEAFLPHKSPSVPGSMTADAKFDATAAFAGLFGRVNLVENAPASPYLLVGGGLNRLAAKGTAAGPVCWPLSRTCASALNGSSTAPYLTGGAGFEFFVLRGMTVTLEGRFRQYRTDGKTLHGDAESLSAALGTTFVF